MAYSTVTNIPEDPVSNFTPHAKIQGGHTRWFQNHVFTVEITTTPQSLRALIEASVDSRTGKKGVVFSARNRVDLVNPATGQTAGATPTIYAIESPADINGAPVVDNRGYAKYAIEVGSIEEIKAGAETDFSIWCNTGTCAILVTERG